MKLLLENWREYLNENEKIHYAQKHDLQGWSRKKWRDFEKGIWELIKKFENEDNFKEKLRALNNSIKMPDLQRDELLLSLLDNHEDTLPEEVYDAILDFSMEII